MKAKCRHCKNKWTVSRKYAGATIMCPSCREPVGLPPRAPIGALILTAIISAGTAVGVSSWMLSKETDAARISVAAGDLQARLETATEQLDKFKEEFTRVQSQIERADSRPPIPQIAKVSSSSTLQIGANLSSYGSPETQEMTDVSETAQAVETTDAGTGTGETTDGTTEPQNAQDQPQMAGQKLDDPDSLLIFEGTVDRILGPRLFIGTSAKKVNQFTYSNFKYVPPFVLESAVIEVAPGVELNKDILGVNLTVYVVEDGQYQYKETIGAIEIPKLVKKYRETNLTDVPEQQLVEFQGGQPMVRRGGRMVPMPKPKSRQLARKEMWRDIITRKRQQKKQLPK